MEKPQDPAQGGQQEGGDQGGGQQGGGQQGGDPSQGSGGGQDPGYIEAGIGDTVWRPHPAAGGSGAGEAALAQRSAGVGIDPNPLTEHEQRDLIQLLVYKYGNLEADVKWKEIQSLDYAAQRENLRILRQQLGR